MPVPSIQPPDGSTGGFTNPFLIDINWSSEGTEYTGDSHAGVTLTKGRLDGADILGLVRTADDGRWTIPISNIAPGAHTLVISGRDDAGNTLDDLPTGFTVVAPNIIGTVTLEGRTDHGGTMVAAVGSGDSSFSTTTSSDGSFGLSPPPGVYVVMVEREGFLAARRNGVNVHQGRILQLPAANLLAGDVDGNGLIDLKDLILPAKNLGKKASPWP